MKSNKVFFLIILVVFGVFFTCTILYPADKTHSVAKSEDLPNEVAEVESAAKIPTVVTDVSPLLLNTDRVVSIQSGGVTSPVLHSFKHNDPNSVDHQWDNIASIGANEKNAVPIGGSKDIKTPYDSSVPFVEKGKTVIITEYADQVEAIVSERPGGRCLLSRWTFLAPLPVK